MRTILKTPPKILLLNVAAVAVLSGACSTFGAKGPGADDDGLAAGAGQSTVVIQAGQSDPVVASHDRRYWLDLRQKKDVQARLRGALATGEGEAAVQLAKARLAKHPGDPEATAELAAALVLTRNYELAAYYASQLDRLQPGNPIARNIRGLATMLGSKARMADFRRAEADFQQAFDADATQIAPGLNLGNLQLELGNAGGASQTFARVVERCGQCTPGLMGLGIALSRSQQWPKAEAAFQSVLARNPKHAAALYNLALVYKNGYHNKDKAEKCLFALLNDSRTKNVALRERAQVVLRIMKGEASQEERTAVADDETGKGDAEVLMTGAAKDDAGE